MSTGDRAESMPTVSAPQAMGMQAGGGNIQHNHYYAQALAERSTALRRHWVGVVPQLADCRQDREIDRVLAAGRPGMRCQVLTGPGGVGKTQLAAGLARRLWDEQAVDLLIWVTATSRAGILTRFVQAADDVVGLYDQDPEQAVIRFLAWLAATDVRWLVVLDDLTDPADVTGLWPPESAGGQTVVTTRRRDAALLAGRRPLDVGLYTPSEACRYLQAKLGDGPARQDEAEALAADLGYLPLALAQAAAYIVDQGLTCADYRQRLARRRLADLAPHTLPDDHGTALAASWSLSVDLADQLHPQKVARPVLELACLLDPNAIPAPLFASTAVTSYCALRAERPVDPDDTHDAVRLLHRLNLLTADDRSGTLRMHALVQRAVREAVPHAGRLALAAAAADALTEVWPDIERERDRSLILRASTTALLTHTGTQLLTGAHGCHPVLFQAGRSLGNTGMVAAAVDHFHQLFAQLRVLAPDHPDTMASRAELASWRGQAGDLAGAVADLEVLLTDRARVLGADHPDTLKTRHDYHHWNGHAGDPAAAAAGLDAVLSAQLRVLGSDHPDTLSTRGNLAHWRGETGDPAGAASAVEILLADRLRVLGPEHPRTLITRMTLAFWRGQAGDATGAVSALEALLADQSSLLGTQHPDTFTTRSNLAHWRGQAGDPDGAARAFADLLRDRLEVLGPENPRTLITRGNLAHWQGQAGDAASAVRALEDLLADQIRVLGPDHPQTLSTRGSLAHWSGHVGDATDVADALNGLLADQIRVLGPDHPDTRETRRALRRWQEGPTTPGHETLGDSAGRHRHVSE